MTNDDPIGTETTGGPGLIHWAFFAMTMMFALGFMFGWYMG